MYDEPAAGAAEKPCVNASNTHHCMLCGLAIPGAAEHAGIELKALDRFERLAAVLREARLTAEQRAEAGGLLNGIKQSYRKLAEDRDGWRNAMASKPKVPSDAAEDALREGAAALSSLFVHGHEMTMAEVGAAVSRLNASVERRLAEVNAAREKTGGESARAANGKIVGFEHDGRAVTLHVQIPPPSFPVSASDAVRLTWRIAEDDKEEPR